MMDKAKLINKELPYIPTEIMIFDINPSKISINKSNKFKVQGNMGRTTAGTVPGATAPRLQCADPIEMTLSNLYIEGIECKNRADQLNAWMQPWGSYFQQLIKSAVATVSGRVNQDVNTPTLIFQWGPPIFGFVMECKLMTCNMEFTRFSPLGTPTRLLISSMKLLEVHNPILYALTNPTSGGLPGRESHTVIEGETLQHLSRRRYGQPHYWRALADANGIDDPMRVRPGRNVYLPSTEEVVSTGPSGR